MQAWERVCEPIELLQALYKHKPARLHWQANVHRAHKGIKVRGDISLLKVNLMIIAVARASREEGRRAEEMGLQRCDRCIPH